jgi:hypothetical protein
LTNADSAFGATKGSSDTSGLSLSVVPVDETLVAAVGQFLMATDSQQTPFARVVPNST